MREALVRDACGELQQWPRSLTVIGRALGHAAWKLKTKSYYLTRARGKCKVMRRETSSTRTWNCNNKYHPSARASKERKNQFILNQSVWQYRNEKGRKDNKHKRTHGWIHYMHGGN